MGMELCLIVRLKDARYMEMSNELSKEGKRRDF